MPSEETFRVMVLTSPCHFSHSSALYLANHHKSHPSASPQWTWTQQFPPVWGTPSGITVLAGVTCSGAAGTSVFTEPPTVTHCLKVWSLLKTNWNTKFANSPTKLLLPTSGVRPGRLLRQPPNFSGSSFKPQVFHSWRTGMMSSYKSLISTHQDSWIKSNFFKKKNCQALV